MLDVDANARTRGYVNVPDTNVSVKPDEWRYFESPPGEKFNPITMFIRNGKADSISFHYPSGSLHPTFGEALNEAQREFGEAAGADDRHSETPIYMSDGKTPSGDIDRRHSQSAYWSDGKTVIRLSGSTQEDSRDLSLSFHDLTGKVRMSFGRVGGGKRVYFHPKTDGEGPN
ncbi:hypothetical protein ACFL2T_03290 [Elusimicrobiota bacterium]